MNTLLCCIGRMENQYIREYVDWYKKIGFTNIALYDNNYDGEEDFHDVIGDYIDDGFVILKDYRNREVCQLQAYNECYNEYGKDYDWIAFFDCDEFFTLVQNDTVESYLSSECFKSVDVIMINWMIFGDNGLVKNDGRKLMDRFTMPVDYEKHIAYNIPENYHVKCIVRTGIPGLKFLNPHTTNAVKRANNAGLKVDGNPSAFLKYDFSYAYLKHYSTKTIEEYCGKMKRGFPDQKWDNEKALSLLEARFFRTNDATREKVDYVKERLGVDLSFMLSSEDRGIEKDKDVKIYSLCYSRKNFEFLDNKYVTPLQVGAANGTNVCYLKDNTGANISAANFFYIENTGTYWIWQNVKDAKYKGQMQYRRPLEGINDNTDFDEIFKDYDVITCEPFNHPSHKVPTPEEPLVIVADTVEQGYAFSNCGDDLYILEMYIKSKYPDYVEDYDKYIKNGPDLYYSNGFIMKSEDFDRYCEFLFDCLLGYLRLSNINSKDSLYEHVRYNIEVGKYQRYPGGKNVPEEAVKWQTEIGGFLSERIWTLWLQHNFAQDKIYKLPYKKMEQGMYT